MQITFFIGNGFDRAMGLHTSYKDFYRYCVEEITSRERKENTFLNVFMNELKDNQKHEFNDWADLEQKIGNFMPFPITDDNVESYGNFHEEIGNKLVEYLKCENERVDLNGLASDKLSKNFDSFFETNAIMCPKGEEIKLAFIVFNYTDVFENILIKSVFKGYKIGEVLNVHGSIKHRSVVFGIGSATSNSVKGWDSSKLLNNDSREKIKKWILKEKMLSNKRLNLLYKKAVKLVEESDYIITFGASIGETDYVWWKHVNQALRSELRNCQFLVNRYTEHLVTQAGHEKDEDEVKKIMQVILKVKSSQEEYDRIKNRIHIIWNSSIFSELGVTRLGPNNGIRYENFQQAQKILLFIPVKNRDISKKEEEIRVALESICEDKNIISKLPMESIPKCEENNGKKRIYYACIYYKDENIYRTISRLLDVREDGLSTMHIDNVIMLMDFTNESRSLDSDELEMVINNVEWYIIRKLGKEWKKHFLFALGVGKNTGSNSIKQMAGILIRLIKDFIDKDYVQESIEVFYYVPPYAGLNKVVMKSINETQSKRGVILY